MDAARDLHRLLDRALGDDDHDAVVSVRLLTAELTGWVTERAVLDARRAGSSWASIARLLRLRRQAVHRRFRHLDHIADIGEVPRRPDSIGSLRRDTQATERFLAEITADRVRRRHLDDHDDVVPW
ncbi:MAG: hypothetical protein AAGG08_03890 [Actinomycetota bacterium]